ncbi:MAG: hypothetical protein JXB50_11420 [Spirochaetes bacterium]|nr:hypothetical protein [Spirochaetota bacterium]
MVNCGKYKSSLFFLKKAILSRNYYNRSSIYYYLIIASLKLYNYAKAKYYFNKSFDWNDKPFFIFLSFYELSFKNIDTGIKLENLESILPEEKTEIFNRLTIVIYSLLKKEYKIALNTIKRDYNDHCELFFYKLIYLKTLFRLKEYDEIIDFFINNIEYLNNTDLFLIYAASLYKLKFFDESKKILDEILNINKYDIIVQINIAKILIIKKKFIKAIYLLKKLEKHSKKYTDSVYFYLSICYHKLGLLNDFVKYALKISKGSKEFDKIMLNLSITYYDLGYYKKSEEVFANIDKKSIDLVKYDKWHNLILNNKNKDKKLNILKNFINLLPIVFFVFLICILIFFLLLNK